MMEAQRMTEEEIGRLEDAVSNGSFTHNLPTIMRLLATIRYLRDQASARMIPLEGTVK